MKKMKKLEKTLPWIEKYRPGKLDDLIGHSHIIETIRKFMKSDCLPNLLFYGPPGTGKTSAIIACAKEMYGDDFQAMVLELNASDERGINVVRHSIKNFVSMRNLVNKGLKLVILDEADNMTSAAQFALRRTIELAANNARFCLICNYSTKVISALQSRCTKFKFKQIDPVDCVDRLNMIAKAELLNISKEGLKAVMKLSEGDMRRCVNMLQSVHMTRVNNQQEVLEIVDDDYIYSVTGSISPKDINRILQILLNDNIQEGQKKISQICLLKGLSLNVILKELSEILIQIKLPSKMKEFIYMRMTQIEYRLSINCNESMQLSSLVAGFNEARHLIKNI